VTQVVTQALSGTRTGAGATGEWPERTRVLNVVDDGSFRPFHPADASGAVAGAATVEGSPVMVYASDPKIRGGALTAEGCGHIIDAIQAAAERDVPVLGVWHSGGAALQEGVASLDQVARMFAAMTEASGRVPQISLVLGPAAGGAAYGPALTDIVVMAGDARIFVTGPDVVRKVTGQDLTAEQLGGSEVHGRVSGVAHITAGDLDGGAEATRALTALLARPGEFDETVQGHGASPDEYLPDSPRRAYDVRPLVGGLLDGEGIELHASWARNISTILGRLAGRTVGVIANNPRFLGGCLDAAAGDKAARFVRMCDSFGIPLVVVVDVPGYLPGSTQERQGVIRRGAKLLHAFAQAQVPRVTLVTRKAYGGAYIAMNSRGLGATAVYAWPDAEIGIMDSEAAVAILHRRELAQCAEPERGELLRRLVDEHLNTVGGLPRAIENGSLDAVVQPAETRAALVGALASAVTGRGHQTNIPL
jgi:acetyl-CoA/propionyl-CoA carboxylase carboxyl transferase subunit